MNFILGLLLFILLIIFVFGIILSVAFPSTCDTLDIQLRNYIRRKYPIVKED